MRISDWSSDVCSSDLKAGHAGTLDPLATGILPVALGEATKTVPYVMDATKDYDFTIEWGVARSTDDREGAVSATSAVRPDVEAIRAATRRFVGVIEQVRSEESRVGKECVSTLRSRGSPIH